MPLQQIAKHIVSLADRRASTPVLITPPYLSFRASFFIELTGELANHTERPIRVDWYRGMPKPGTLLTDQLAAWQVRGINRTLQRQALPLRGPGIPFHNQSIKHSDPDSSPTATESPGSPTALPSPATVQVTATIARPGGQNRDFVIGLADSRLPLPEWTTAIWLGSSPEEIQRCKAA